MEQLRTVVASLQTAVAFSRALAGAMPTLTQLLASSSLTDVQESILLLMACRRFAIEGADATIRKMLPLIFSREQGKSRAQAEGLHTKAFASRTWAKGFNKPAE